MFLPRVHLPLSNQEVLDSIHMIIAGKRVDFRQGVFHYVDVSIPHYILNRSPHDRMNLILDFKARYSGGEDYKNAMLNRKRAMNKQRKELFPEIGPLGPALEITLD